MGGLANGIERNALAPLGHVEPIMSPAWIVALGTALAKARPEKATKTKTRDKKECIS